MRPIQLLDQVQLRRIDDAITRIECKTPTERRKAECLLAALRAEKEEILKHHARPRRQMRPLPLAA